MDESKGEVAAVHSYAEAVSANAARSLDRETEWRACVRRIAARDQAGLTALYDESSSMIYGLAVRVLGSPADAEEITVDVYTQVWRTAGSYQESRGSVVSWLAMMARSRAIDRLRSRAVAARSEEPLSAAEYAHTSGDSEDAAVARLDTRRMSAALQTVPAEQRRVLELAYFSGMTQSEMAKHLDLPIGTVKTRIRLGLMRLREIMEGKP